MGSKSKLLERLEVLVSRHQSGWANGAAYVSQDGSFGLKCGYTKERLYSAYFVVEKLTAAGLLTGPQLKNGDLDTAMYTISPENPIRIYKEAKIYVADDGEIILKINRPKMSEKEILDCVEQAILLGDKEIEAKEERERAHRAMLEAEKIKEQQAPVLGSLRADFTFVAAYVIDVTEKVFPGSAPAYLGQSDLEVQLSKLEGFHDLCRPGLTFSYGHKEGVSYARDNEFLNRTLPRVFNGYCAVHVNQMAKPPRLDFTIFGNPSRLANDILTNDPEGASQVKASLTKAGIRL